MTYLAVDVETTGLSSDCNVLTAFFIILDDELNEIDTLDLKIKHKFYKLYTRAMEVNKIDIMEHDQNSIYVDEAVNRIDKFLSTYKKNNKYILLGHNIAFDLKMLKNNLLFTDNIIECYISPNNIDTLTIAKFIKSCDKIPKKQSLSLTNLCQYFDITLENTKLSAHNAEYDIKLTVQLFKHLQSLTK